MVIANTNLLSPSGLTIDFTEDRLFWCDQRRGVVETAALDGSDRQVLLEKQVGEACVTHTCMSFKYSITKTCIQGQELSLKSLPTKYH